MILGSNANLICKYFQIQFLQPSTTLFNLLISMHSVSDNISLVKNDLASKFGAKLTFICVKYGTHNIHPPLPYNFPERIIINPYGVSI